MKITVLDGYGLNPGDLSWEGMAELGDLTVYDRTSPSELLERAEDSEILITNKTVLNADTISKLPKLKYIGVLATGYNVVDIEAARKAGVVVTNIPAYSTMSVAQTVFALLLAATNRVEHYTEENKAGRWSSNKDFCWWDTPLEELDRKRFGIFGLGHIGETVARIALAFGMKVYAVTSKTQDKLPDYIIKITKEEMFSTCDVISLHCPLTPETSQMIDEEAIRLMSLNKPILINTARGGLINEKVVAHALQDGKLKAYCTDVLSSEPPAADNPLLLSPNTFITPHIAWATEEARKRLMNIAVDNLKNWLAGKMVNVVNLPLNIR